MAGNNGPFLAEKYTIPFMIYSTGFFGDRARRKFENFANQQPTKIQVFKSSKSKYPDVDVIEWGPLEDEKCEHRWDIEYSPDGARLVFCTKCDQIKPQKINLLG